MPIHFCSKADVMMEKGKAAKSVIRVVIVPKLSLDKSDSDEESELTEENEELDNETDTDDDSEKFEVPEIVITETDEVIEGMKRSVDNSRLMSSSDNLLRPDSAKPKFLTTWKEAARPKQPKLLPDSFVEFVTDCKNLIADLRKTMDERLDAGEWILEFDKNIERLEQEEKEERERLRREREREEATRARAEAWWRRRAINRPLANPPVPRLTKVREEPVEEDGRSCHDRVCILPLLTLKKRLEKVERLLLVEGSLRQGLKREDVGKSTQMVVEKMTIGFNAYLAQIQAKADGLLLEVHGEALIRAEDKGFDIIMQQKREYKKEVQEEGFIEEILHVGRKRVYGKVVARDLADQYRFFRWKFTKTKGTLRLSKRRRGGKAIKMLEKAEDVFAIFNPEKSKRAKGFQVFGSTLHRTMTKHQQHGQMPNEDQERKKLTKTVAIPDVGQFETGKIFSHKFMLGYKKVRFFRRKYI